MKLQLTGLLSGIHGVLFDLDGTLLDSVGGSRDMPTAARLSQCQRSMARPGAEALVVELRQRGVPLAVATSSERRFFAAKTGHHGWFSHFDVVVCGDDPGVARHKPSPDVFWRAARLLGAAPTRCLGFEDSAVGVEAARRARLGCVVVVSSSALDRATTASVHAVLASFGDLDLTS